MYSATDRRDEAPKGCVTGLCPGNTFMTLKPGDVPEIEAPGGGTLRNTVMAEI